MSIKTSHIWPTHLELARLKQADAMRQKLKQRIIDHSGQRTNQPKWKKIHYALLYGCSAKHVLRGAHNQKGTTHV